MRNLIFSILTISLTTPSALSQTMDFQKEATEGFRSNAKILLSKAQSNPRQLNLRSNTQPELINELNSLFFWNSTKALIVAKDNDIIYEKYAKGLDERITPLGYSMTKSITAITVGYALCEGLIKSIDDRTASYLPQLENTSWGNSSIRNLLIMSSGSFNSTQNNGHYNTFMTEAFWPSIYLGNMNQDYLDLLKSFDRKAFQPGTKFVYNNFDTLVLGLLLENTTGMSLSKYFENTVWRDVGAETDGAWLINNLGQVSTFQGFSATPRDWIRLGLFVLKKIKDDDECIGSYLKQLSTPKIKTNVRWSKEYGYQTWMRNEQHVDFAFAGFGGQYLIFNKEENIVLYHHATSLAAVNGRPYKAMTKIVDIYKQK